MGVLRRKPDIRKLASQLEHIECELQRVERTPAYLLSLAEMRSLHYVRFKLSELATFTDTLEPQLWRRIEIWQNTPYTAAQSRRRRIVAFIGWWIAGTLALAQSVLGWFTALFPKPWHMLAVSAAIAFILVAIIAMRESMDE